MHIRSTLRRHESGLTLGKDIPAKTSQQCLGRWVSEFPNPLSLPLPEKSEQDIEARIEDEQAIMAAAIPITNSWEASGWCGKSAGRSPGSYQSRQNQPVVQSKARTLHGSCVESQGDSHNVQHPQHRGRGDQVACTNVGGRTSVDRHLRCHWLQAREMVAKVIVDNGKAKALVEGSFAKQDFYIDYLAHAKAQKAEGMGYPERGRG